MLYHKVFVYNHIAIFPICKAACTSIQQAIQSTGKYSKMVGKLQPGELEGKKVYVMVRHPHDRLVSFYHNKIVKGDRIEKDQYHEDFGLYVGMPFEDMTEVICSTPDDQSNRHFRSQVALVSPNNEFLPTHSWHMEQISDFWDAVQKEVDVPDLGVSRKTPDRKHFKKYYNDRLWTMVQDRYQNDFEVFGF